MNKSRYFNIFCNSNMQVSIVGPEKTFLLVFITFGGEITHGKQNQYKE